MSRVRGTPRRPAAPALMEEIEPRILFAADLAAFALPPAPGQDAAEVRLLQTGAQEHDNLAALLLQSIPVDSRPAAQI
ncbi:MAG TPA: LEPR-XLL domain-containing protein, partial [Burkholderiaceae bacterium]|nr:LEPR-XLL domain-containing protein [Burkholderiaceae bacterium]